MKRIIIYRLLLLTIMFFLSTGMINNNECNTSFNKIPQMELLYNNVSGTIYHAVVNQCDDTPNLTGDGSKIDPNKASNHRWIAISQEMLNCITRANILDNPNIDRFKGKIQYGDTIWIESPYPNINGWWVVHDTKNVICSNSIDFLQTVGDGSLYDNNPLWSGKFNNIKIYRLIYGYYSKLQDTIKI